MNRAMLVLYRSSPRLGPYPWGVVGRRVSLLASRRDPLFLGFEFSSLCPKAERGNDRARENSVCFERERYFLFNTSLASLTLTQGTSLFTYNLYEYIVCNKLCEYRNKGKVFLHAPRFVKKRNQKQFAKYRNISSCRNTLDPSRTKWCKFGNTLE
jgi:hypothetical protein